jgi:hypothetical protein
VFLYVLADHRVEKQVEFGSPRVSFADWIEPGQLEQDSPLAPFVSRKLFLTKVQEQIFDPKRINDDYVFTFAPQDEVYFETTTQYVYDIAGVPIFLLVCVAFFGFLILLIVFLVWLGRRVPARAR